ncbi:MAG TPA: ABC transporter ATP-binding protein [bacterium]|nr:ABC transporter ATP-binding protein [bacterium]
MASGLQTQENSTKEERREALRAIASFFWLYRRYTIWGIVALLVVDAAQLITPLIIRSLVDRITGGTVRLSDVPLFALAILAVGLVVAGCRFAWFLLLIVTSERIARRIRGEFFTHLLSLSQRFFHVNRTGDLMARISNDTEAVRMACGLGIITIVDGFLFAAAAIALMVHLNASLALYALIPLPVLTAVVVKFGRLVHSRFQAVQARVSDMMEKIRDAFAGIRVVKTFCQEAGELERVRDVSRDYLKDNMRLVKVWGAFFPLIWLLAGLSTAIVFYKGGKGVILGEMSVGTFLAFSIYLETLTWPMIALGHLINLLQRGTASMVRINRIMNVKPKIIDVPDPVEPASFSGLVEVKSLTFAYDANLPNVLKDVTFRVEPGKTLAIVGRTGSGKSTVVRLLLREFDPPPGSLLIDGIDVREMRMQTLRSLFGYVPQDSFLFSETVRENIAFSNEELGEGSVKEFARMSAIDRDIAEFPKGYDTIVGERGVMLSGGQKQRVAIARALVKNPYILLLDDCLSAVDAQTEAQILDSLKESIRGVTTIIVSHRLSAVQLADEIVVLDEGEVKQRGTHAQLLKEGGIYAALFAKQQIEQRLERDV